NLQGATSVLMDIARLYMKEEDFENSSKQLKKVLKNSSEMGDIESEADALTLMGEIFDEKKNIAKASEYYLKSAEKFFEAKLYELSRANLDIVESNLMSLPKATRRRLRNKAWDLKAKLPKKEKS
ncbi:MAG: hypothetical protein ACTSUV_03975, partial [Candidatus Ranarchaeia archaeon]